jgi:hypothetical protein
VRSQIEAGLDPVRERVKEAGIPTFREAAALVYAEHHASWKNKKHAAQWLTTLTTYAFPHIGDMSVSLIEGSMCAMRCCRSGWPSRKRRGACASALRW